MTLTTTSNDDHTPDKDDSVASGGGSASPTSENANEQEADPSFSDSKKRKRGRPRIKPDELATERIEVRVHPSELAPFKQQCAANNLTVPAALRQMIATGKIEAPAIQPGHDWSGIAPHMLRNFVAYGNNLNQTVAALNLGILKRSVHPAVIERLQQDVRFALQILEQIKPVAKAGPTAAAKPPAQAKKIRWPWFGRGA